MARAVSRQPLRAEALIRSKVHPCEMCGGRSGSGTLFLPEPRYSRVNIFPPMPHTHFQVALIWEPSKSNALSIIGEHWIEKHFAFI
jgi:hypothetical protein